MFSTMSEDDGWNERDVVHIDDINNLTRKVHAHASIPFVSETELNCVGHALCHRNLRFRPAHVVELARKRRERSHVH